MPSELYQMATSRTRRNLVREVQRDSLTTLARQVRTLTRGRRGQANRKTLDKQLSTPEVKRLIRSLEKDAPVRYSQDGSRSELDRLLGLLGPVGNVIRSAISSGSASALGKNSWDKAVNLIRAFGGEVLTRKGNPEYDRGVQAARELLEEAGYEITGPDEQRSTVVHPEDFDPQGEFGVPDWIMETEQRVSSGSVHSYSYIQETENYGTLYVTFKAWTPHSGKSDGPGATYAYHDITPTKYRAFSRAAQSSAGKAVWDYLRVRGSAYDHQHPYELVGGVLVQNEGLYIPRKASTKGYMRRTLRQSMGGRTRLMRSQLASREYSTGEPNRGEPNRGAPNRG